MFLVVKSMMWYYIKWILLKISPPSDAEIMSYENNIMRTEVETMKLLKEKTNLPIPYIYYYDDSKTICNTEYFYGKNRVPKLCFNKAKSFSGREK